MCGITAWISNQAIDESVLRAMSDMVVHRGPDDSGLLVKEQNGRSIGLAHRRLSIIDLSSGGHQPMEWHGCVIVYNGEIYNYRELKRDLEKIGWTFDSETDTEVLLTAYRQWGGACLHRLNGMFAFVILDYDKNQVFVARDRFGIKPLYYRIKNNDIQFVSEIKQLTVSGDTPRVADGDVIANFLVNRYHDYSDKTFFKGVYQLEPGHCLTLDLSDLSTRVEKWYDLQERIAYDGASDPADFRNVFESSVALRMRADVEVGSSLSGGLDSTSIVATADRLANRNAPYSLKTVTASFNDDSLDEWPLVEKLRDITDIKALRIRPDGHDLFSSLDEVIWAQDEPVWSSSVLAQYMVFQTAKESKLKIMLDGQGSDEFLLGYVGHAYPCYIKEVLLRGWVNPFLKEVKSGNFRKIAKTLLTRINRNPHKSKHAANLMKNRFNSAIGDDLRTYLLSPQDYSLDQLKYHLRALLHYEDRNSMAASIETRLPFLDYRLVEFVMKLNSSDKIQGGLGKYILRKEMDDKLPSDIVWNNKKLGFKPREDDWDNIVTGEVGNAIKRLKRFDFFNHDYLDELADSRKNESTSLGLPDYITRLLAVERWLDVYSIVSVE